MEYGLEYVEADDERYGELMALAEGVELQSSTPTSAQKIGGKSERGQREEYYRRILDEEDVWLARLNRIGCFHRPETPRKRRSPRGGSACVRVRVKYFVCIYFVRRE